MVRTNNIFPFFFKWAFFFSWLYSNIKSNCSYIELLWSV